MARSSKHTIILSCDNVKRKCCKILFTGDGSFSITAPYHAAEKAILFKATFNYENNEQEVHLDETIDLSELDEGRLKITYHRSGFVQYSGDGVISGIDNNGVPKGLGLFTVPLEEATIGPLVIIAVENLNELEETRKTSKHDLIFDTSRLAHLPNSNGLVLEAHYFQPAMRRFVQKTIDGYKIQVVHPNGFVVSMPIIFAPDDCDLPGMIGLELYEQKLSFGGSGFSFSGPGGIARKNKKGQPIAETLMCMYPRPETFNGKKSLDYKEIK